MHRLGILLLCAAAACGGHYDARYPHAGAPSDELSVTRAVLYQNGIGYFERRGQVKGNTLTLRIRADQIADFLKSLTVVDLSKDGRAVSVALPVEKSQSRQMANLPPQVREHGGILAIAAAFRGARAEIDGAEGSATGRIVGVEQIDVKTDDPAHPNSTQWRLTILEDETLKSFDVAQIRSLHILDRTLTLGLEKALDVTLNEGSWKPIEMTVSLAGSGPHDLVVSYVVEMPTWKPAYRVVLEDGGQALVQGWAVVDNVSGEDWNGIKLSLTAGTPLAFAYDLYTPHYVRRPDLSPPQEENGIALGGTGAYGGSAGSGGYGEDRDGDGIPDAEDETVEKSEKKADRAPAPPPPPPAASRSYNQPKKPAPAREVTGADLERNYRTLVAGAGVGSLFRYDLAEPITVKDRESALVSVVSTKVPGDDVLIFRVGLDQVSPYRSARLKNETGFVLEKGPVAIYRNSTFLGEALTARLEKDATAFVPYALDTRVQVILTEEHREEGMRLVTIANGHLVAEAKEVTRFAYEVDNHTNEKATLYVQRARRAGWVLTKVGLADDQKSAPPQPGKDGVLADENVYSVPIALPEKGKIKVAVEEETPARREVEILSVQGREVIAAYLAGGDVNPNVAVQLKAAVDIADRLATIENRVRDLDAQRKMLGERETQVRDNLTLLHKTAAAADMRKTLEEKLGELEKSLDAITLEYVKLTEERAKLKDTLAATLKNVTLKRK